MLAFLVMCVSTSLSAQDKKLSIVFDNETLTEVFRKLENVSDYHFVVNGDVSKFKVNEGVSKLSYSKKITKP